VDYDVDIEQLKRELKELNGMKLKYIKEKVTL